MRRRTGLRATAGWAIGSWLPRGALAAPPGTAAIAADPVRRGRPMRFPRDHGAHLSATIEWWYVTGTLLASDERRFGFQITFFRARTGLAQDLPSRFAPRQLLFAHAALTDLAAPAHHHTQRLARWSGDAAAPTAHAKLRDTGLLLGGWTLQRSEANGLSHYQTRFGNADSSPAQPFQLDLQLNAAQAPLLQGEAGYSLKGPGDDHASHYVSEPQLAASGTLQLGGKTLAVRGRAWLDHEWSDSLMHPQAVGWDWVGMNLDDGSALTAAQLRRADGHALWAGGSWRDADGHSQTFAADAVRFTPLQRWRSPASEADYPLHWRLQTPVGDFEVRALLDAQELDSRASTGTVYWEGLSELLDAQGRRVGLGYLEMTGYAGRLRLG
ncbi:MAG: carotenoid 1,2-hydratase [Rubrivivax sp.]